MDTSAYSSNWSVFYTGTTQIAEIRKNAFGALGGFLGKIVVKTRGLLQTMYWALHTVLAYFGKTKNKNRRFPPHNSLYNCFRTLPTKNCPDARTKTAQKRRKKCFTHFIHTANNTQKKPQISEGYMFLKKALTSAGNYSRIALLFGHSSVGRTTDC